MLQHLTSGLELTIVSQQRKRKQLNRRRRLTVSDIQPNDPPSLTTSKAQAGPSNRPDPPSNAEPSGPVLGPSGHQELEALDEPAHSSDPDPTHFSAVRTSIQDLTLPPVPNLDIPPSPPGSPDPGANAKFAHFLTLKKQGVHFNEKLAGSSSLKNPSLLVKLREHVGIDDQEQYSTSLPDDIWDASKLPEWGYKEELLRAQQETRNRVEEKKATGQRGPVEFVSGTQAG